MALKIYESNNKLWSDGKYHCMRYHIFRVLYFKSKKYKMYLIIYLEVVISQHTEVEIVKNYFCFTYVRCDNVRNDRY